MPKWLTLKNCKNWTLRSFFINFLLNQVGYCLQLFWDHPMHRFSVGVLPFVDLSVVLFSWWIFYYVIKYNYTILFLLLLSLSMLLFSFVVNTGYTSLKNWSDKKAHAMAVTEDADIDVVLWKEIWVELWSILLNNRYNSSITL